MQYDALNPKEYLGLLEPDWRKEKLLRIRKMILDYGYDLDEFIIYKMLGYGNETSSLFGLNTQKHYVSLYVGDIDKIKDATTLLRGMDTGKGCVRIKKTTNLEQSWLEIFIQTAIDAWRNGNDPSC